MESTAQIDGELLIGKQPSEGRIRPAVNGNAPPLSFAQQQIWLHAQLVPGLPIYNEPVTLRRHGTLDVAALGRALSEIVRRHHAWRTTFVPVDGDPVQVVQPPVPVLIPQVDLSHINESEREAEARRLANEDALRPFDLSEGPLFRFLLVHFSDTDHRLFLTLHHIIFDGYSIYRVFLPELAALYAAFSEDRESPLLELPVQYPDYAAWEREWLSRNGHLSSQLAYWRKHLQGNSPVQLPLDHRRPAIQSFRGAIHPVALSKEAADGLKWISRREGTTLFMTLLAAFAVLLQRYSSQDDVAIGTVSSGRKRSELEGLLGYFLNPLVLRNDLSGDPTFVELLRRTRNITLDALSNDDAPFTQVVNEVRPSRSLSVNPLFQVLLTLEPPLPETQQEWTVALTQSEADTGITKFDLCLELDDRPTGILGRFKYSTDLFDPETVARMAGHLTTLIESIVANPDQRISTFSLLTAPERQMISRQLSQPHAESAPDVCLHELVTRQCERTPDESSLTCGGRALTYRELDGRSNQLARYLQGLGIGPEVPVGLYFEPSSEMIVGILAVLKAGGVCVPLDPSYPVERLEYVVKDTQLRVFLTQKHLRPQVPAAAGAEIFCLDSDWERAERQSADVVHSGSKPENLAYLIYTSGSTGKPKGVEVTHRNLVHSTHARALYYGPTAGRFLLLSSFAFDSSLAGIFGTLSRGGTLVLTSGPLQESLTRLHQIVAQNQVSELLCVPSLYALLLDQARPGDLDTVRVVIVAGESCPEELVKRHYKLLPWATLFNEYGPTEAAVWSTVYKCSPDRTRRLVPIGRAIPNVQVHVLDPHLNPSPVGVPGELHVGGPGVARGYHNRPEETAKSFIPDPFSPTPSARLYKTGDLVRSLPDGNLEFLRRLDHQVKINGFRIELEEIEALISEFKGVRQVVAAVCAEKDGGSRLIAYVVPADLDQFHTENLRTFLSQKLPATMIPSEFVRLESLPLMPNGKVNRAALPVPDQSTSRVRFVEPEGPMESKLVEVWKAILGKTRIGITDNFFDLGGNSLLVAKLLLRIEQRFGKRLSLADIFQEPTIRQLAVMLDGQTTRRQHPAIVPIQPQGTRPPLFWVRGGPLFRPLANRLGPDQPMLGIHLPPDEASRLSVPYKLEEIAAALVTHVREVQPEGPYSLAGLCVNAVIAYEMARQLVAQGHEVALLAMVDGQNPAYYQNFSQESRGQLYFNKAKFHWNRLRQCKWTELPKFFWNRMEGINLRLSVLRWRLHHALGLKVNEEQLRELDTIVHPSSYLYRPKPYPQQAVFFQSTDWPEGRYWNFYESWDGLIAGGMTVHKIAGGHQSMFHENNVDALATLLRGYTNRAVDPHAPTVLMVPSSGQNGSKSTAPRFREATFEDYPQIASLESRYGLNPRSYEEWTHSWTENPVYRTRPDWPIGWVCENGDNEIVGCVSNIPLPYEFDNQPVVATTSRSLVMDTRYRPYSYSLLNYFFKQKNVDIFLNTTVNEKALKLQQVFQASPVPAGVWDQSAFWITDYVGFTASLAARREMGGPTALTYPMSAGLFLKDALAGKALRIPQDSTQTEFCEQFDDRFDVFWDRFRKSSSGRLLATRTRDVLEWHFKHAFSRGKVWIVTVADGADLAAYGIFYRQDNPEFGLKRMRLVDFQTLQGRTELLKPILYAALRRCQREGVHMLEAIGFSSEKRRLIDSMRPHSRKLASWRFFYKANDKRLADKLTDAQAWDPTGFDGDSSL
jgi:amino acid adenylation domain-containing protein